jgi:hypothetical protein
MSESQINRVSGIYLCDFCLDGKGGICTSPGCFLMLKQSPDIAIRDLILLSGGKIQKLKEEDE